MRRFPLRTLALMLVALAAFFRLWWATHQSQPPRPSQVVGHLANDAGR